MAKEKKSEGGFTSPMGSSGVNEAMGKPWEEGNMNKVKKTPDPLGYVRK